MVVVSCWLSSADGSLSGVAVSMVVVVSQLSGVVGVSCRSLFSFVGKRAF